MPLLDMRRSVARLWVAALALSGAYVGVLALAAEAADARERTGRLIPRERAEYHEGPSGRYLLSGIRWVHKTDHEDVGLSQGWHRERRASAGYRSVRLPHTWNVNDNSVDSQVGSVGWYRSEFYTPNTDPTKAWVLRFEGVNHRARVFLNGRELGRVASPYVPYEFEARNIRRGRNILVVRVDSRREPEDLPPGGLRGEPEDPVAVGGWKNYGGIIREVYLRRVDRVDYETVRVRANVRSRNRADIQVYMKVRNLTSRGLRVRPQGTFGRERLRFGTQTVGPRSSREFTARVRIRRPRLWSPKSPRLYPVNIRLTNRRGQSGSPERGNTYRLRYGIRRIDIRPNGILRLNFRPLRVRGASIHEDHPTVGKALRGGNRRTIVDEIRRSGSTMTRSHYPLHPHFHELFDRHGILVWSEVPVYSPRARLNSVSSRRQALDMLERNIVTNRNRASVLTWSIFNELSKPPGPSIDMYIRQSRTLQRRLDPTRPLSAAVQARPTIPYVPRYRPLDLIGINTYFGWYPGPENSTADTSALGPYLDRMRADYGSRGIALMVTEFGAEANREGPEDEKGTYAFQRKWSMDTLDIIDQRPWLAGALYWTLQEFRIRPGWNGGNPLPGPDTSMHQKGLISFDGRTRKPAWSALTRRFRAFPTSP